MSNVKQIFGEHLEQQVHVWRIDLNRQFPTEDEITGALSALENARALTISHFEAHRRFKRSHFALRDILARYLHKDRQAIQINTQPSIKPKITDEAFGHLKFNLSHSDNLAVCALTTHAEVGIDVEKIRAIHHFEELSDRFLSAREAEQLRTYNSEKRLNAFFQIWTAKEAYLKALGIGLSGELKDFNILLEKGKLHLHLSNTANTRPWLISSLDIDENYIGSLAIPKPSIKITYFDWELNG